MELNMKIRKILTQLFFLNNLKMTLTNLQWISPKIKDLHQLFVEISICNFFLQKLTNFALKCVKFLVNSGSSILFSITCLMQYVVFRLVHSLDPQPCLAQNWLKKGIRIAKISWTFVFQPYFALFNRFKNHLKIVKIS